MRHPTETTEVNETVLACLFRLYAAASRRVFSAELERLLSWLYPGIPFSLLIPVRSGGGFSLAHSSCLEQRLLHEKPVVVSRELDDVVQKGGDRVYPDAEPVLLDCAGHSLPVATVKLLSGSKGPLGLLVFHEDPSRREGGPAQALSHVVPALQLVLKREEVQRSLERSNARLQALQAVGPLLAELELKVLLAHLIVVFMRLTNAQVGSIVLEQDPGSNAELGLPGSTLERIRKRGGPSVAGIVMDSGKPRFITDYSVNPDYEPVTDFRVDSFVCLPLASKERVLGTVNLVNSELEAHGGILDTDREMLVSLSCLAAMAVENGLLHEEVLRQERIKAGLQIASSIQRGMYPQRAIAVPGYDIAWTIQSCDETGGDYFDFVGIGGDQDILAIGDVSGHGIGAALLMATSRANLRALLSVNMDLEEVMARLNGLLAMDMDSDRFMTMCLLRLDHDRHSVVYVNAGHDRPLLYCKNDARVLELKRTQLPLGMLEDVPYNLGGEHSLLPGDVLLLTTDGIWEASDAAGELFGRERLRHVLAGTASAGARGIMEAILEEVEKHCGGLPERDDRTLAVLKRVS